MRRFVMATAAALGLAAAGLVALLPVAAAQESGSLIIAVMNCPDGYEGDNYSTDCTGPAAGITFTAATPNTDNVETTESRGDGLATFSLAPFDLNPEGPDRVIVGEPAIPGEDYAVACTLNGNSPLDVDDETTDSLRAITFSFNPGDDVGCEWYRISRSQPSAGSSPESGGQVAQLPSTGAGPTAGRTTNPVGIVLPLVALAILAGEWIYSARHGR